MTDYCIPLAKEAVMDKYVPIKKDHKDWFGNPLRVHTVILYPTGYNSKYPSPFKHNIGIVLEILDDCVKLVKINQNYTDGGWYVGTITKLYNTQYSLRINEHNIRCPALTTLIKATIEALEDD